MSLQKYKMTKTRFGKSKNKNLPTIANSSSLETSEDGSLFKRTILADDTKRSINLSDNWWENLPDRSYIRIQRQVQRDDIFDDTGIKTSPFPNWWSHVDNRPLPFPQYLRERRVSISPPLPDFPATPEMHSVERRKNQERFDEMRDDKNELSKPTKLKISLQSELKRRSLLDPTAGKTPEREVHESTPENDTFDLQSTSDNVTEQLGKQKSSRKSVRKMQPMYRKQALFNNMKLGMSDQNISTEYRDGHSSQIRAVQNHNARHSELIVSESDTESFPSHTESIIISPRLREPKIGRFQDAFRQDRSSSDRDLHTLRRSNNFLSDLSDSTEIGERLSLSTQELSRALKYRRLLREVLSLSDEVSSNAQRKRPASRLYQTNPILKNVSATKKSPMRASKSKYSKSMLHVSNKKQLFEVTDMQPYNKEKSGVNQKRKRADPLLAWNVEDLDDTPCQELPDQTLQTLNQNRLLTRHLSSSQEVGPVISHLHHTKDYVSQHVSNIDRKDLDDTPSQELPDQAVQTPNQNRLLTRHLSSSHEVGSAISHLHHSKDHALQNVSNIDRKDMSSARMHSVSKVKSRYLKSLFQDSSNGESSDESISSSYKEVSYKDHSQTRQNLKRRFTALLDVSEVSEESHDKQNEELSNEQEATPKKSRIDLAVKLHNQSSTSFHSNSEKTQHPVERISRTPRKENSPLLTHWPSLRGSLHKLHLQDNVDKNSFAHSLELTLGKDNANSNEPSNFDAANKKHRSNKEVEVAKNSRRDLSASEKDNAQERTERPVLNNSNSSSKETIKLQKSIREDSKNGISNEISSNALFEREIGYLDDVSNSKSKIQNQRSVSFENSEQTQEPVGRISSSRRKENSFSVGTQRTSLRGSPHKLHSQDKVNQDLPTHSHELTLPEDNGNCNESSNFAAAKKKKHTVEVTKNYGRDLSVSEKVNAQEKTERPMRNGNNSSEETIKLQRSLREHSKNGISKEVSSNALFERAIGFPDDVSKSKNKIHNQSSVSFENFEQTQETVGKLSRSPRKEMNSSLLGTDRTSLRRSPRKLQHSKYDVNEDAPKLQSHEPTLPKDTENLNNSLISTISKNENVTNNSRRDLSASGKVDAQERTERPVLNNTNSSSKETKLQSPLREHSKNGRTNSRRDLSVSDKVNAQEKTERPVRNGNNSSEETKKLERSIREHSKNGISKEVSSNAPFEREIAYTDDVSKSKSKIQNQSNQSFENPEQIQPPVGRILRSHIKENSPSVRTRRTSLPRSPHILHHLQNNVNKDSSINSREMTLPEDNANPVSSNFAASKKKDHIAEVTTNSRRDLSASEKVNSQKRTKRPMLFITDSSREEEAKLDKFLREHSGNRISLVISSRGCLYKVHSQDSVTEDSSTHSHTLTLGEDSANSNDSRNFSAAKKKKHSVEVTKDLQDNVNEDSSNESRCSLDLSIFHDSAISESGNFADAKKNHSVEVTKNYRIDLSASGKVNAQERTERAVLNNSISSSKETIKLQSPLREHSKNGISKEVSSNALFEREMAFPDDVSKSKNKIHNQNSVSFENSEQTQETVGKLSRSPRKEMNSSLLETDRTSLRRIPRKLQRSKNAVNEDAPKLQSHEPTFPKDPENLNNSLISTTSKNENVTKNSRRDLSASEKVNAQEKIQRPNSQSKEKTLDQWIRKGMKMVSPMSSRMEKVVDNISKSKRKLNNHSIGSLETSQPKQGRGDNNVYSDKKDVNASVGADQTSMRSRLNLQDSVDRVNADSHYLTEETSQREKVDNLRNVITSATRKKVERGASVFMNSRKKRVSFDTDRNLSHREHREDIEPSVSNSVSGSKNKVKFKMRINKNQRNLLDEGNVRSVDMGERIPFSRSDKNSSQTLLRTSGIFDKGTDCRDVESKTVNSFNEFPSTDKFVQKTSEDNVRINGNLSRALSASKHINSPIVTGIKRRIMKLSTLRHKGIADRSQSDLMTSRMRHESMSVPSRDSNGKIQGSLINNESHNSRSIEKYLDNRSIDKSKSKGLRNENPKKAVPRRVNIPLSKTNRESTSPESETGIVHATSHMSETFQKIPRVRSNKDKSKDDIAFVVNDKRRKSSADDILRTKSSISPKMLPPSTVISRNIKAKQVVAKYRKHIQSKKNEFHINGASGTLISQESRPVQDGFRNACAQIQTNPKKRASARRRELEKRQAYLDTMTDICNMDRVLDNDDLLNCIGTKEQNTERMQLKRGAEKIAVIKKYLKTRKPTNVFLHPSTVKAGLNRIRETSSPEVEIVLEKLKKRPNVKTPRVKRPAWLHARLYKSLKAAVIAKIKKNGTESEEKAEEIITELALLIDKVLKYRRKGRNPYVDSVVKYLYRSGVIKTPMNFICFCMKYLPEPFIEKALRDKDNDSGILGDAIGRDLKL